VEVSALSSFTMFAIIQIALHLKLCVDTLSFAIYVWLFARIGASDPLPPDASTCRMQDILTGLHLLDLHQTHSSEGERAPMMDLKLRDPNPG